jgi:AAA ATPase domain
MAVTLYGRDAEQKAIAALLDNAAAGNGGALMFHGDLGIGKTALLISAAADATDFAVVELRADRSGCSNSFPRRPGRSPAGSTSCSAPSSGDATTSSALRRRSRCSSAYAAWPGSARCCAASTTRNGSTGRRGTW